MYEKVLSSKFSFRVFQSFSSNAAGPAREGADFFEQKKRNMKKERKGCAPVECFLEMITRGRRLRCASCISHVFPTICKLGQCLNVCLGRPRNVGESSRIDTSSEDEMFF